MFERLLAKRYIITQKRHSILTVCSIIVAIALMTSLFTAFSTAMGCIRDIAYHNAPYHYKIMHLTLQQAQEMETQFPEAESVKLVTEKDYTCSIELFMKDYIGDTREYFLAHGIETVGNEFFDWNQNLTNQDLIDLNARARMAQYFAMFYVLICLIAVMLRLMIDTAFEVSSKERERQFGVLQSIGATPKQIVNIITFEGLLLSAIGIPLGVLCGVGLGYGVYQAILSSGVAEVYLGADNANLMQFHVNTLLLVASAITGLVWVLLSAYGTGMRIIKMTPIQAISNRSNTVKKVRRHSIFGLLFGWMGKMASRNNRRQPKRFIITTVSLTLSILLFSCFNIVMEKFETLMDKSIQAVYDGFVCDFMFEAVKPERGSDDISRISPDEVISIGEELENVGYFKNVAYDITQGRKFVHPDDTKKWSSVSYVNEAEYHIQFPDAPVTYDELTKANGYLLVNYGDVSENYLPVEKNNAVQVVINNGFREIEEKKKKGMSMEEIEQEDKIREFPIAYRYQFPENQGWYGGFGYQLIQTIDYYQEHDSELYGNSEVYATYSCDIVDDKDYPALMAWVENNPDIEMDEYQNFYLQRKKLRTMTSAIEIGVMFLNVMIALIAIVNMVNILSTGILNRKSELASLQCIGMTEGQLYGMTAIECVQYALISGVTASLLSFAVIFLTEHFVELIGAEDFYQGVGKISYTAPLPRIWICALVAFAVALIASFIPLKNMQKESLSEQIRSID